MTTGEKIQSLRKKLHITQEDLADSLKVSRQSVSRWEQDLAYPETDKVVALAKIFKVTTDYLLNDQGELSVVKERNYLNSLNMMHLICIIIMTFVTVLSVIFYYLSFGRSNAYLIIQYILFPLGICTAVIIYLVARNQYLSRAEYDNNGKTQLFKRTRNIYMTVSLFVVAWLALPLGKVVVYLGWENIGIVDFSFIEYFKYATALMIVCALVTWLFSLLHQKKLGIMKSSVKIGNKVKKINANSIYLLVNAIVISSFLIIVLIFNLKDDGNITYLVTRILAACDMIFLSVLFWIKNKKMSVVMIIANVFQIFMLFLFAEDAYYHLAHSVDGFINGKEVSLAFGIAIFIPLFLVQVFKSKKIDISLLSTIIWTFTFTVTYLLRPYGAWMFLSVLGILIIMFVLKMIIMKKEITE